MFNKYKLIFDFLRVKLHFPLVELGLKMIYVILILPICGASMCDQKTRMCCPRTNPGESWDFGTSVGVSREDIKKLRI